jgi:hypothetical protein
MTSFRWQLRALASEAAANAWSSPSRVAVLGAVVVVLTAAMTWLELGVIGDARALEDRFADAGGYVAVVSSENGVDAHVCDALISLSGVVGSGGVRAGGQVTATTSPRVNFQRFEVTRGILRVWDPALTTVPAGHGVGQAAAEELGLSAATWVDLGEAGRGRTTVLDPAGRNPFAARAFLDLVPPEGRMSECWVEFSPDVYEAGLQLLPALFAADEGTARRVVDRGEFAQDPSTVVSGRLSQWTWIPAGLAASSVFALVALLRRSETAVYRAFGLSRLAVLLMLQIEVAQLTVVGVAAASLWTAATYAAFVAVPSHEQMTAAMTTAALFAVLVAVVAPFVAAGLAGGSPASLLKER